MLSVDTETTGLDLHHGAKPFLVTICNEDMEQTFWEWDVDPLTREPEIPESDIDEIEKLINDADQLILQNPKFDIKALSTIRERIGTNWDWDKTIDTVLASHLLASNEPKDLTTVALKYLGIDLEPFETRIRNATKKARNLCRSRLRDWRIANKGLPEMPSAKETVWKNDMWLPRAIWKSEGWLLPEGEYEDHPWSYVLSEYANSDSAGTMLLFRKQTELLKERGLWEIFQERLKILPVVYEMEEVGVTLNKKRLEELRKDYEKESWSAANKCISIAKDFGYGLNLPKSGNNNSLLEFCFGRDTETPEGVRHKDWIMLPEIKKSSLTGKPSLDAEVMKEFKESLPERSIQACFIKNLSNKRKRDTALNYLKGYERYWLPVDEDEYRLHPSLNPTGTNTLRWSSKNPNEQNISNQEGFNLRYAFGPAPGREWWSLDANNIELRLPAYEAGETEMIALFEKPDEAPFFGSYHLLVFSVLHPDKWDQSDPEGLLKAKKKYNKTWYQWTKNGNFAVQYGAVVSSGTADRAYHVPGGQEIVQGRFKNITKLNKKLIAQASKLGYVETIPDKTVNPDRGYPLICQKGKWGKAQPTIPLNYHIQSTAMQWMTKAMVRCYEYLKDMPDFHMVMQVHDEIVFDFPLRDDNLELAKTMRSLMEKGGDDIGIPTPVSVELHTNNWSEGETV